MTKTIEEVPKTIEEVAIPISAWQKQHPGYNHKPHIPNVSSQGRFFESHDTFGGETAHYFSYICGCYQDADRAKGHYKIDDQVTECEGVTFFNNFDLVKSRFSQGGSIDIHCDVCNGDLELTPKLFDKVKDTLPQTPVMETTFSDFYKRILAREVSYWN